MADISIQRSGWAPWEWDVVLLMTDSRFLENNLTTETGRLYRIAITDDPEEPNLYEKRTGRFKTETKTFSLFRDSMPTDDLRVSVFLERSRSQRS